MKDFKYAIMRLRELRSRFKEAIKNNPTYYLNDTWKARIKELDRAIKFLRDAK